MPVYTIETHGQLRPALEQEWLLTNGLGGFTSGTVAGCNARRYHALLCAATLPPVGRVVALNRLGEILTIDGADVHELSVNQFGPDTFHPHGERYLRRFELWDTARWEYDVAGVRVAKEVLLCWKRDVVAVRYRIEPPRGKRAQLELLPMVSIRDFHSLQVGTDKRYGVHAGDERVAVTSEKHTLHLRCAGGATFKGTPDWWKGHWYGIEAERGQDHVEDLYTPGRFVAQVNDGGATVTILASMAPVESIDWDAEVPRWHSSPAPRTISSSSGNVPTARRA